MQVLLRAEVFFCELAPEDIRVELCTGRLDAQHEFIDTTVLPLELEKSNGGATNYFRGILTCSESGAHGYTLRVVPSHRDLRDPLEMGLIRWAEHSTEQAIVSIAL
jgi:starch phosphorylase